VCRSALVITALLGGFGAKGGLALSATPGALLFDAYGAALLLINTKDNTLASLSTFGLSDEFINKGPISVGFSLGEVPSRKPVIISCVARDTRIQYKEAAAIEKVEAILGLPLWVGGEIAGVQRLEPTGSGDA